MVAYLWNLLNTCSDRHKLQCVLWYQTQEIDNISVLRTSREQPVNLRAKFISDQVIQNLMASNCHQI